jgi:predicted phosphohydrolase
MSHESVTPIEADVAVFAGDSCGWGSRKDLDVFCEWFAKWPAPRKIMIAGNHDWCFQRHPHLTPLIAHAYGITYLRDDWVIVDGVKFYGSPWQPWFHDWAFNLPRDGWELRKFWEDIPEDTDVLITHGPPYMILDKATYRRSKDADSDHGGCKILRTEVITRIKPKVHIFGHIHEGYGMMEVGSTTFVNAASLDESYINHNPVQVVEV